MATGVSTQPPASGGAADARLAPRACHPLYDQART